MKHLVLVLMAVCLTAGIAWSECYQDQYGNQYDFVIDYAHNYLYGEMISAQGCDAPVWYLMGSFTVAGGIQWELTTANPLGDDDLSCIPAYKIKGTFPNGAWYYTYGYGGQEFTLQPCTGDAVIITDHGGTLK